LIRNTIITAAFAAALITISIGSSPTVAKARTIKPEFFDDEILGLQCSRDTRLLYQSLWVQADDYGNVRGAVRRVRLDAFPYDDDLEDDDVRAMLDQLEGTDPEPRIVPYAVNGQAYFHLPKLYEHLHARERKAVDHGTAHRRCPEKPRSRDFNHLDDPCTTRVVNVTTPTVFFGSGSGDGSGDGSGVGCARARARLSTGKGENVKTEEEPVKGPAFIQMLRERGDHKRADELEAKGGVR